MNKPEKPEVVKMFDNLAMFNLRQHVTKPTHCADNIIDLIITKQSSKFIFILTELEDDYFICDHRFVTVGINLLKPKLTRQKLLVRKLRGINLKAFQSDLNCELTAIDDIENVNDLVSLLNSVLCSSLDKHAPITEKLITNRKKYQFDEDLECQMHSKEKIWQRT